MEQKQQNIKQFFKQNQNQQDKNKSSNNCDEGKIGEVKKIESVPGLFMVQDFLNQKEEQELITIIDQQTWNTALKRRTQHYGYIYDYSSKSIDESNKIGDLPDFCQNIINRMLEYKIVSQEPDQLIINEYEPGQGINSHIDKKDFFQDTIISISLGSQCIMEFSKNINKQDTVKQIILKRRSLVKLSGEARQEWKHGIKARKYDTIKGVKYERQKRISLTFRNIIKKKVQTQQITQDQQQKQQTQNI